MRPRGRIARGKHSGQKEDEAEGSAEEEGDY